MKKHIVLFLAFQFLVALACYSAESSLVYPGTNGKLVYVPYANNAEVNNDNTLPDFSNVGYMDGAIGVPVGEVPVKITLNPTSSGEDRTRIQDAIDQVCNMPLDANGFRGAVLLKKGTYRLNDGSIPVLTDGYGYALRIWASGVVLRGEGQGTDGTILYSDFALNHTMITLEPLTQSTSESNMTRITDAYVGTGAKTFTVADASSYAIGDKIIVRFTPNDIWFSDLKVTTGGYINDPADYWTVAGEREAYNIGFKRKIIAKVGNTITIDCSIVQPMQTKYGGGQITKYATTGRLTKCGVEDLRIVGIEDGGSPSVSGNGNRLRAGIRPRFLDNSWIHGVTVTRTSEAAIMTWGVMNVTVEECAYIDPRGAISGGWRYGFCLDAGSTRVLFQRCYSDYGRHDFVTHARMPGPNVFVDCYSAHGLSVLGPHHRWATGTLFDNIKASSTMEITEYADPSAGHAFCGAQTVGWNLECAAYVCDAAMGSQNFLIGSIGNENHGAVSHDLHPDFIFRGYWEKSGPAGVHVDTRSLYLKQLEDRLGSEAVSNITIPEQRTGNIYNKLASWAGNGKLVSANIPVIGIVLLPASLTLNVGSSQQLAATIVPANASNKNLSWTSDNTAVANVNSIGMVTAVSIGTATITVTTEDGGKIATTAITTINQIFVSSISVLPATASITMGNELQLIATISPSNASNKNITWTSSDTNVATVNSLGLVTSVAPGTCNILVTTQDGEKTAISAITVNPRPVNKILSNCDSNSGWTSSNTLTVNNADKKEGAACLQSVGSKTDDFKKVFSPPINTGSTIENGNLQFWYFVSDINLFAVANQVELGSAGIPDKNEFNWSIGTLQNGWNLVTLPFSTAGVTGGTPDLSAINYLRIYHVKTASVNTKIDQIIIVDGSLNAVSNIALSGVRIFPNPLNQDKLTIKLDGASESDTFKVIVSNLQGQVVYKNNISGKNFIEINTAGWLKSSFYLVSVQSGKTISNTKLIVQ